MPSFPFAEQPDARVRKTPLGPATLNQLHLNARALDELLRAEHLADGQHNALEVPWVLGHVADGATPTGSLFDTTYGGGTLARPATGEYTISVVAGVVGTDPLSRALYSAMANVAGSAIESKPHTITVEPVSATSFKVRTRWLTSAIGAGDTWADTNVNFDFGLHAAQRAADPSALLPYTEKRRNDFLTEAATDWSALVQNQGAVRAAASLEHSSAGKHTANRIARAMGWFRWSGAAYSVLSDSDGISSVSRISTGVVEVTMVDSFFLTSLMACFPEVQPSTPDELVIINGRGFSSGAGSTFRFYLYAFDGTNWARADRSFAASFFGALS